MDTGRVTAECDVAGEFVDLVAQGEAGARAKAPARRVCDLAGQENQAAARTQVAISHPLGHLWLP